ncbi:MAG: glycosyltransferase family 2 protein [Patescibacteria group bacterium]
MNNDIKKQYLHVGQASDLQGKNYVLYRALEMLPAALAWATIVAAFFFSWWRPVWVAVFIIIFDLFWLIKTVFLSFHVRANWHRLQRHLAINWEEKLAALKWSHLWQLVVVPSAGESADVIRESLDSIAASRWPRERMMVVLALEDKGDRAHTMGEEMQKLYADTFGIFSVTYHPEGVPGEMRGKGSNETYAMREAQKIVDQRGIPYADILVSSFDEDTKLYPQYFLCLAWHFLTAERPHRSSFQPVPLYHNNVWEAGALSRVVAASGTFWQMMQQERPERLTTFSSHSMSFLSLVEVDFWQINIVSEDSRIFWNHFFWYDGDWRAVPLSYPVSLDANAAPTLWQTAKNIYKQQRRWGWGVENVPYILFNFIKNKKIPRMTKLRFSFNLLEGFWSWATNALIIFALGWLPLYLGGRAFNDTVLSFNLPQMTRRIMTLAMFGIITSAAISQAMLRRTKDDYADRRRAPLVLHWLLMPLSIIFFGAFPGLEAQTRLALGGKWRLGFWVTPKFRESDRG